MRVLAVLLALAPSAARAWSTSFNLTDTFYFQAADSSFFSVSLSGASVSNASLSDNIDAGSVSRLSTPPSNGSVILGHDKTVYAFHGECNSSLGVSSYSVDDDSWSTISVDSSDALPDYSSGAVYFVDLTTESLVYIFGGSCSASSTSNSETFYSSLSAYNTTSAAFVDVDNTNPPVALANASALTAGSYAILFGGVAEEGWIGMSQLAVWEASSWSYKSVLNSSSIDSRTNPLVILSDLADYAVVIGGYVDGRAADPNLAVVSLSTSSSWSWSEPSIDDFPGSILGAAMLPGNVLVAITNDTDPDVVLLNTTSWTYLSSYSSSTLKTGKTLDSAASATSTLTTTVTTHSGLSRGSVAAIATLSVIAGLVTAYIIYSYIAKRRRRRRPLGPLTPNSDQGIFLPSRFDEKPLDDSDNNSVTTWEEKRQTWIKKYSGVPFNANDPIVAGVDSLAANMSGNNSVNSDEPIMMRIPSPATTPFADTPHDRLNQRSTSLTSGRSNTVRSTESDSADSHTDRSESSTIFGISRKSIRSFRHSVRSTSSTASSVSAGGLGLTGGRSRAFRRRVSGGGTLQNGLGIKEMNHGSIERSLQERQGRAHAGAHNDDEDEDLYELFKDREVQVLVSTKRKGKLRITNPDEDQEPVHRSASQSTLSPLPPAKLSSSGSTRTRWLTGNQNDNSGYSQL
ncbi:hypothetical protein BZA70DRAFT_278186 [Myxozyma melibiosi]|uniref:Galactose oxidase n=1 Tax=Myxozyma melibiosi TaxID=54550 RepID=A0ABR1F6J0_9ASCO